MDLHILDTGGQPFVHPVILSPDHGIYASPHLNHPYAIRDGSVLGFRIAFDPDDAPARKARLIVPKSVLSRFADTHHEIYVVRRVVVTKDPRQTLIPPNLKKAFYTHAVPLQPEPIDPPPGLPLGFGEWVHRFYQHAGEGEPPAYGFLLYAGGELSKFIAQFLPRCSRSDVISAMMFLDIVLMDVLILNSDDQKKLTPLVLGLRGRLMELGVRDFSEASPLIAQGLHPICALPENAVRQILEASAVLAELMRHKEMADLISRHFQIQVDEEHQRVLRLPGGTRIRLSTLQRLLSGGSAMGNGLYVIDPRYFVGELALYVGVADEFRISEDSRFIYPALIVDPDGNIANKAVLLVPNTEVALGKYLSGAYYVASLHIRKISRRSPINIVSYEYIPNPRSELLGKLEEIRENYLQGADWREGVQIRVVRIAPLKKPEKKSSTRKAGTSTKKAKASKKGRASR